MAQPDPLQIAQHLHHAADNIALFSNLPAVHEGHTLHDLMNAVTRISTQLGRTEETMGRMQTDLVDMRREMNNGFTRLEARIAAV